MQSRMRRLECLSPVDCFDCIVLRYGEETLVLRIHRLACISNCCLLVSALALARDPRDQPNVIVVMVDDSGYGDYAHSGNPVVETPTISRLANEGAHFTQFYVPASACSASRYSLVTGRYPGRSGFGTWVLSPQSSAHLRLRDVTIAEGLKELGYATAIYGKWHLGNPNKHNQFTGDAFPLAHGFDEWLGTNVSHDYDDAAWIQSDPTGTVPIHGYRQLAHHLPSDPIASASLTGRYAASASDFIRKHRAHPFFMVVTPNQPHLGLYVTDAYRGVSRRGLFGDVMRELDDAMKTIVDTLAECDLERNTLIIYLSDNGPWVLFRDTPNHPKYGEARLHIGDAAPFRDGKGSNWEGGHRVPGIFYWPGVIPPKRQLEPASSLDVLPTVFSLCGANLPHGIDGRDICRLLIPDVSEAEVSEAEMPPFTMAYSGADNRPNAIREGPWKLHIKTFSQTGETYGAAASRTTPLLFQVEQDPGERIDRAGAHPEIVKRLLGKLDSLASSFEEDARPER